MLRNTFIIILSFAICFLAGQFVSTMIAMITGFYNIGDIQQLQPEMYKEINILKLIQFISSIFTFILPPFIIAKVIYNSPLGFLKLNTSPNVFYYCLVFIFMITVVPLMNLIIEWNNSISFPSWMKGIEEYMRDMEDSNGNISKLILTGNSWIDLIVNLCVVALIPAIGEELTFRGVIQSFMKRWVKNPHIAIFITAFLFSAIHFQFYGFIPRLLLGMFFGYLVYFTGSLWPAIFAHFANNGMAVISYFLMNRGVIDNEIDSLGTEASDIYYLIFGIIIAGFIGKILFKKRSINNSQ